MILKIEYILKSKKPIKLTILKIIKNVFYNKDNRLKNEKESNSKNKNKNEINMKKKNDL